MIALLAVSFTFSIKKKELAKKDSGCPFRQRWILWLPFFFFGLKTNLSPGEEKMMKKTFLHSMMNWASLVLVIVLLAACAPAAPAAPAATEAPATLTPAPTETSLPSPTPTLEPTATTEPTATATPMPALAVTSDGYNGWCLPKDTAGKLDSETMPKGGIAATVKNGLLAFKTPANACALVFTFNQAAPQGLKLEVYSLSQAQPWLTVDLVQSTQNPNIAYAILTHSYIKEPPFWSIVYRVVVKTTDGASVFDNKLDVRKWEPYLCWDFSVPDPVTLYCPSKDGDWHIYVTPVNHAP
jgi:hypothetical protein